MPEATSSRRFRLKTTPMAAMASMYLFSLKTLRSLISLIALIPRKWPGRSMGTKNGSIATRSTNAMPDMMYLARACQGVHSGWSRSAVHTLRKYSIVKTMQDATSIFPMTSSMFFGRLNVAAKTDRTLMAISAIIPRSKTRLGQ